MLCDKPSEVATSYADTAPLSLPAPSAPCQGDSVPNPARTLGGCNDSEQTADRGRTETPTIAPARSWVKPLRVWAPGAGLDRRFASATRNRRLRLGPAQSASPSPCAQVKLPEKRGVVLVTAELMGDPKPEYLRAELRQDEGRSASVAPDD